MTAHKSGDPTTLNRLYGRSKGKALRAGQQALVDTLLPQIAVPADGPVTAARLFGHDCPLHFEIGFGGGEHLAARADMLPDHGFIGCEPFLNGMAKGLALIETHALTNVRLHFGDATDLLAWLPADSLAHVDLLYPDPWHKRRHWKRRFVQDNSIAVLACILRADGLFRFATDIPDYAAWTLERVLRSRDFAWTAERADDWRVPWAGWVETRYEAKAKREGRTPNYFMFRRG
jgi:tRNA (guanine-N7-)-methyltransferase